MVWWLYLLVSGLLFLPFTDRFFCRFFDKGYMVAKVLGFAVPAYGSWLLASVNLLPFTRGTAFIMLLGPAFLLSGIPFLFRHLRKGPAESLNLFWRQRHWHIFFLEEGLFLTALAGWAFIRGHNPAIYGLEKFMDFGFVNAALNAASMPPPDMWFAGEAINYYYFGHYVCAFLTKLTGIDAAVAYNLMMASLFAFTFALVFSLAGNLAYLYLGKRSWHVPLTGLMAGALLTLGSNLHTFIYAFLLPTLGKASSWSYYYPDSTRFIGYNPDLPDKTIHEFPAYSFVVADLHGHVSSLPFVLSFLLILLAVSTALLNKEEVKKGSMSLAGQLLPAFFLALLIMTNTWDFPIYLVVAGMVLTVAYVQNLSSPLDSLITAVRKLRNILIFCILLAFPFLWSFQNFSDGIGLVHSRTPLYQLLILWGFYILIISVFLAVLCRERCCHGRGTLHNKGGVSTKACVLLPSDKFVLVMILASLGLILLPELVYVKDIYSVEYYRANTMFKLTYQATVMLAPVAAYGALRLIDAGRGALFQSAAAIICLVLFGLPLLYPFWSLPGYYGPIRPGEYHSLNGLAYLEETAPGDLEAITWLKMREEKPPPVILEADGESYSDYGRISMATGYATILGWHVHQLLWRGDSEEVARRAAEVAMVYGGEDLKETRQILAKYNVSYIIVGDLERDKYPGLDVADLVRLGDVVFTSGCGKTTIIAVH